MDGQLAEVAETFRQEANSRLSAITPQAIQFARAGETVNIHRLKDTARIVAPGEEWSLGVWETAPIPQGNTGNILRPDLVM